MRHALPLVFILICAAAPQAQVANMPNAVQARLAEVGPVWGNDIPGNIARTLEVYAPILRDAPKAGVQVTLNLAYGQDQHHKLDLYRPEGKGGLPIVVFIHGGAYVSGDRSMNAEVYANVGMYVAQQGLIGVNVNYRLAPAAQWPAGAEDVGALVQWLQTNASTYGGDARRIYLVGHSAGATHVATYAYLSSLHPAKGPGIAGMVLMSGRYLIDPKADDPNRSNVQAYFGSDAAQYVARSPLTHVKSSVAIPTFIVVAEYDNPDMDTQGALLFAALCERDRACPRFTRMEHHNHLSETFQFNTADDALGREILEFIRRGR